MRAAGDRLDAGEAAQQRGLAGAVGADDGDDLAGVDREVDAVQHLDAAVAGAQALDVKHGRPPVPEVGLDDLGVAADDRGLALGDLLAVVEDDDVVRDAHDHLHVVLHEQDGDAGGGDLGDQVVDLLGLDGVAAGGGLVEEEDAGLERQRAGDLEPLQRAVGERARLLLGGVAEADAVEERARALGRGRAARRRDRGEVEEVGEERALLLQVEAGDGVLEHRHRLEDLQVLEGAAEAAAGEEVGVDAGHVLAVELHAAGRTGV